MNVFKRSSTQSFVSVSSGYMVEDNPFHIDLHFELHDYLGGKNIPWFLKHWVRRYFSRYSEIFARSCVEISSRLLYDLGWIAKATILPPFMYCLKSVWASTDSWGPLLSFFVLLWLLMRLSLSIWNKPGLRALNLELFSWVWKSPLSSTLHSLNYS